MPHQSGGILVFNEGDCPKFDSGDAAFTNRMLVAPMRSKFVIGAADVDDEFVFEMDPEIHSKFDGWCSALADILLDHMSHPNTFNTLPVSMTEWRQGITMADNPLAQWLDENTMVTGNANDVLLFTPWVNPK